MTKTPKTPGPGDWIRAIKPGTLKGGKFVKADEKVQLGPDDVFSDNWMEATDAPISAKPPSAKEQQEEQDQAARQHEEEERIRQGKFSRPAVPRSPEGQEAHEKREEAASKEDAKAAASKAEEVKRVAEAAAKAAAASK